MKIQVKVQQTTSNEGYTFNNLVLQIGNQHYPIQVVYGKTPNRAKTQAVIEMVKCFSEGEEQE